MADTTMAATSTEAVTPTALTDDKILTQLATLQSLHSKIFQLRSLLPERLIDPVRAAVEASRSGYEPPAVLATHLRSVAVDGDKDVKEFKERWRSEAMTEVWKASKESAFPQGSDIWSVDYRELVGGDGANEGEEVEEVEEENVDEVLEIFKTEHPRVKVERREDDGKIAINVTVADQTFTLTKSQNVEEGSAGEWVIVPKAGGQATKRLKEMLRSFQERPSKKALKFLLEMIDSYADLKTRSCEKCQNIFDNDIQLPAIRIANPKHENGSKKFLAYHRGCM